MPSILHISFIKENVIRTKYVQKTFHFFSRNMGTNSIIINRARVTVQRSITTSILTKRPLFIKLFNITNSAAEYMLKA